MLKALLASVLIVMALFVGGVSYIIYGAYQESMYAAYRKFFPGITLRALQSERLGEVGVPAIYNHRAAIELPPEVEEANLFLRELWLSDTAIDCNLDLEIIDVDLRVYWGVSGVLISYSPLRYVVFFEGDPPDVSDYLDATKNGDLLGFVPPFEVSDPTLRSRYGGNSGSDLSHAYTQIGEKFVEDLTWTSARCGNYSYIEYREESFWH